MDITDSLYTGQLTRLAPIDHEKDPAIIARWTLDPLWRAMLRGAAQPFSPEAAKKLLEKAEKQMEEAKNVFHFTVRVLTDDRLVGLAKLSQIDYHNGIGAAEVGIGERADRRHGYGFDALKLLLNFALGELNLHRISVFSSADNIAFLRLAEKAGFEQEVCRREAAYHDGRYWDVFHMYLLRATWEAQA